MKNICFVANYFKTDIFVEIAKNLEQHDIHSYWIIPSRKQYNLLRTLFSEERLLYIGKKEVLATAGRKMDFDLKANELIYGDRVLREESADWTFDYLLKLQPLFYDFIKLNNIHHVFGEITWAHELTAQRLARQAKELDCKFYSTQTIRIPNGRFAFFTDDFESQILEVDPNSTQQHPSIELVKPTYLAIMDQHIKNQSSTKGQLKKLKNFVSRTNQDVNDPTLYSQPYTLFKIRTREVWNRIAFKQFVSETTYEQLPMDKKFILMTLHKQPEASIDVYGRYYENQLHLINNIWRILPEGYILLVKEHSNAIGDRGLKFYRKVKKLRNTVLIHHKEDSHRLIDLCDAVFTVSGTIAYETALKGKRSFTFAPAFFNRLSNCNEISWKDFRNSQSFFDFIHEKEPSNIKEFSNWLFNNSFEGIMTDAYTEPLCLKEDNINKLSGGFLTVINQ